MIYKWFWVSLVPIQLSVVSQSNNILLDNLINSTGQQFKHFFLLCFKKKKKASNMEAVKLHNDMKFAWQNAVYNVIVMQVIRSHYVSSLFVFISYENICNATGRPRLHQEESGLSSML